MFGSSGAAELARVPDLKLGDDIEKKEAELAYDTNNPDFRELLRTVCLSTQASFITN